MTKILLALLLIAPSLSLAQQTKTKTTVKKETVVTPAGEKTETVEETVTETTLTNEPTLGEKAKTAAQKTKEVVQSTFSNGGDHREAKTISIVGEYSVIDLLIPGKLGGSIGILQDRGSTIEAEYLGASFSVPAFIDDIGRFSDKRISLVRRSYGDHNSFNLHYGLSYFDTMITVGSKYLATASNTAAYSELMKQRSIGFIFGLGNRWTLENGFTFGIDWFSYAQPLLVVDQDSSIINAIQDQGAKQTLQDAFQASLYFPRFSFFKVGLGWSF